MGDAGAEDRSDMGIVQRIINLFAFSAAFDESCSFENGKLMRNRGLLHSEKIANAANAHFSFRKSGKNANPCFIAENLEYLRGFFEDIFRRHICFCLFYYLSVFGVIISQK